MKNDDESDDSISHESNTRDVMIKEAAISIHPASILSQINKDKARKHKVFLSASTGCGQKYPPQKSIQRTKMISVTVNGACTLNRA